MKSLSALVLVVVGLALPVQAEGDRIRDAEVSDVVCFHDNDPSAINDQDGRWNYQSWVYVACAPSSSGTVTVRPGECTCTSRGTWIITLLASGDLGGRYLARQQFWHELGHQFDYHSLDASERAWLLVHMSKSGPWEQRDQGQGSPHETFAEVYAQCAASPVANLFKDEGPVLASKAFM